MISIVNLTLAYLATGITSVGIIYLIKYKAGHYPELVRAMLKTLINKLPDNKWLPMQSQEIIVQFKDRKQVNKNVIVTEKYSIRYWLNFIFSCPFCLSFWIYLIVLLGYGGVINFLVIQTLMIIILCLFGNKKVFYAILSLIIAILLIYYTFFVISMDFTMSILFAIICQELIFKNKQDLWQSDLQ